MAQAKKYKTLLNKSQEETNKEQLSFKVSKAKLKLETSILATQESLCEAKEKLELVKGEFPFNPKGILDAENNVSDIENSIERLEGLRQMF